MRPLLALALLALPGSTLQRLDVPLDYTGSREILTLQGSPSGLTSVEIAPLPQFCTVRLALENRHPAQGRVVTWTAWGRIDLYEDTTGTFLGSLEQVLGPSVVIPLAPYDGTLDFSGPSGAVVVLMALWRGAPLTISDPTLLPFFERGMRLRAVRWGQSQLVGSPSLSQLAVDLLGFDGARIRVSGQ